MNRLEQRALGKTLGVSVVHVTDLSGPDLPDDFPDFPVPCCMGAAVYGLARCTCWEPIYTETQTDPADDSAPAIRAACCHDCAYRNGSPERADGFGDELLDIAGDGSLFACHHGENGVSMRRVVAWRHPMLPDGHVVPAGDGDYRPPAESGAAFLADGTRAPLCAGWAAHRDRLLDPERDRG